MNVVLAGWFGLNQRACFPLHCWILDVQQARKCADQHLFSLLCNAHSHPLLLALCNGAHRLTPNYCPYGDC